MALLEDVFKGSNLWVGIGLAVAAPVIFPAVGAVARPLAKTAIKGYLAAMDTLVPLATVATSRVGDMVSGAREQITSVITEAREEYQAGGMTAAGSTTPETKPERSRTKAEKEPKAEKLETAA
jgi:hypothetical protein